MRLFTLSNRQNFCDSILRTAPVPVLHIKWWQYSPGQLRQAQLRTKLGSSYGTNLHWRLLSSRDCTQHLLLWISRTKSWLLWQELTALSSRVADQKCPRGVVFMRNLGAHLSSTETVFRLIQENEDDIQARKQGLKRQTTPSSRSDPLQEDVFLRYIHDTAIK